MEKETKYDRRTFLGYAAAASLAVGPLTRLQSAVLQSSRMRTIELTRNKQATNPSFNQLKQINAGLLNVGYADEGPADGPVVLLLHGWPYDIHSFADVVPLLTVKGYRIIVPYLRGYGTT